MRNIRLKIQKFMVGRYGMDKLSTFLLYLGLALVLLFNLFNLPIGGFIGWIAVIISYSRALSKNRPKRYIENQKYLTFSRRWRQKFNQLRNKFYQHKKYKYLACPNYNCIHDQISFVVNVPFLQLDSDRPNCITLPQKKNSLKKHKKLFYFFIIQNKPLL